MLRERAITTSEVTRQALSEITVATSGVGLMDVTEQIRSALTQTTLTIPVAGGRPVLGTWQGIYLYEHREHPHRRHIVLHLMGA